MTLVTLHLTPATSPISSPLDEETRLTIDFLVT
jgi:hypothetical protein